MDSFCPTPEYGIETVSRNFRMPSMHYHDAFELYYLEAGTRNYFVEDKLFSVSAGEFVLIPPGKLHRTGGEYCVRTLVHFTVEYLETVYRSQVIPGLLDCFAHVKIHPSPEQLSVCTLLLRQLAEAPGKSEFAIILGLLLKTLSRCADVEICHGFVGNVVAYINDNYAAIDGISQIAEHFFVSKYHLCRVFKNAMHVTIIEYLNQVKLKNARQLLELSDRDVGEIAQLCGYHSVAYFSNIFKRTTGESPSSYRRKVSNQYTAKMDG